MSKFKKDDTVIYKGKECRVTNVYFGDKYMIESPDGKKIFVKETDLKDRTQTKSLDELINPSKTLEEKKKKTEETEKDIKDEAAKKTQTNPQLKEIKEAKPISFSVITRDYINGKANGYESKETIVHGKTKDGVTFEASSYGKDFSKKELEKIAEKIALNEDLTTSKQDNSFITDRVQNLLNKSGHDYIVYSNGTYITGEEINDDLTIQYEDNIEDYGDPHPETEEQYTNLDAILAAREENRGGYTSPNYDLEEEALDELYELSGIPDITERI